MPWGPDGGPPTNWTACKQSRMRAARRRQWGSCQGQGDTRRTGLRRPGRRSDLQGGADERTVMGPLVAQGRTGKDKPCRMARDTEGGACTQSGGLAAHRAPFLSSTTLPWPPQLVILSSLCSQPLSHLPLIPFPSERNLPGLNASAKKAWQGLMSRKSEGVESEEETDKTDEMQPRGRLKGQHSQALGDSLGHSQALSDLRTIRTKPIRG